MSHVCSENTKAQGQRGGADQQVCEWNDRSSSCLLAIDAPRQERRLLRIGVDDQTGAKLVNEPFSASLTLLRSCAVNTMHELGKTYRGESSLLIGSKVDNLTNKLGRCFSAPFGSDDHA